ncbi:MAG: IS66 family insertion sequence element accessory protein TnpB [Mobilitalea sp.]
MLNSFITGAEKIIIACGWTDFRKQSNSLVQMVHGSFNIDPYNDSYVFIFCNRKRDGIKVLRYDKNGFILAHKKLLDKMKFQWPKNSDEAREITSQQVIWLLQGLNIEQKKAHTEVKLNTVNTCF